MGNYVGGLSQNRMTTLPDNKRLGISSKAIDASEEIAFRPSDYTSNGSKGK